MNLYEDMNIYEAMELLNEDIKFVDNKWNREFNELEKAIKKADRIFLFRHIKPDQDALSSVTAWKIMLTKKYPKKEISIATEHSLFGNLTPNDLIIINDLGQDDRVAGKWSGNPVIARIDHHETGRQYNITIEDIEAGSTCELLTIYFNTMKYDLDKTTAELLFKGIITDTGRMQYSLSETTLIALSILRKIGVDYKRIYAQLYMQSNETIRSKKYILSKYLTSPNGVAYLYITPKEANSARIDINSTSSMVYELENIKGCPIWLIASERPDGVYIRLRSRDIDIRPIANLYGGGGHPNACGLKISKNEFPKLIDALDSLLVKKKIKLVEEAGKTEESDTVEKEEYQLKYDEYLKTHISCVQQAYD